MPPEATMMILDNSEFMRNGDYQPTRFEAQADAANTVFQTKTDSNPENTVGMMIMAGKGPEVLVTHSKDLGQILQAIHTSSSKISGSIDIPTALSIAHLALKYRENKNLRQRIIIFVGSPVDGPGTDEKNMMKLATKLKKNNVAVDVVTFGDGIEEGERNVLKAFVDNVRSGDNSHFVSIPPGPHVLLSDILVSSPILAADRGVVIDEAMSNAEAGGSSGGGAGGGAGAGFEFGVDPSLDPELAMALRMSMQEARARQAVEEQSRAPPSEPTPAASAKTEPAPPTDSEEEAMLAKALAMSEGKDKDVDMEDDDDEEDDEEEDGHEDEEMDEEEAIKRAIEMSMKPNSEGEK